uniref:Acetyl-CoA hydrolase n=2 Tax=Steinernema glaseri TaxID=37863 RepID=A0A1I8AJY9_9BILA
MHLLPQGRSLVRRFSTSPALRRWIPFDDKMVRAYPIAGKTPKFTDMKNAFDEVRSGDHIYAHSLSATPLPLLRGLADHVKERSLKDITVHSLIIAGKVPWDGEEFDGAIRSNCLFTGESSRRAVNEGRADFNSVFLSEIPRLFRSGTIKLNVALIHVSPPDANGFCTMGTSVDCSRAALMNANYVIALANKNMPRTFGDSLIHSSHIDVIVNDESTPLPELPSIPPGEQEQKIGALIAEHLVDNGATLQMGIGGIPEAVLPALKDHKDLGIHTEMFSDGVIDLVKQNVVTNRMKQVHPGKIVATFVLGSNKLYSFLDDNPMVEFGDVQWVNDPGVIRQNPKVTGINSCIEVDLTGQVVSDSVGKTFFSGFGGQVDFIRGAALSNDGLGKPIIAMTSTTKKGQTKIVPYLSQGSGVVTTRAHVHYIVTEYGIAQLWGKNMRQRAYELIKIAHPDHRESLEKSAFERLKVMPSPH